MACCPPAACDPPGGTRHPTLHQCHRVTPPAARARASAAQLLMGPPPHARPPCARCPLPGRRQQAAVRGCQQEHRWQHPFPLALPARRCTAGRWLSQAAPPAQPHAPPVRPATSCNANVSCRSCMAGCAGCDSTLMCMLQHPCTLEIACASASMHLSAWPGCMPCTAWHRHPESTAAGRHGVACTCMYANPPTSPHSAAEPAPCRWHPPTARRAATAPAAAQACSHLPPPPLLCVSTRRTSAGHSTPCTCFMPHPT